MPEQTLHITTYSRIVAKTWADPAFRKRLLDEPRKVLAEHGFHIPDSLDVKITPGDGRTFKGTLELPLPNKPEGVDADALHEAFKNVPDICC